MKPTPVGVDIAKKLMQLYWIDPESGKMINRSIRRQAFLQHFATRAPCLIGMEACGGSQHWARELTRMGHQVRLMPARFVKAFNIGNKSDAADAQAIWRAVQQPGKPVAIKSEAQQAVLALHRLRQQLVKCRTMRVNILRGLIAEYGEVAGRGRAALDRTMPAMLETLGERLPAMLVDTLREHWRALTDFDQQIATIERRLKAWMKEEPHCQAIAAIPGVGPMIATAAVAIMGDPAAFRSGREFAAWLGLVPRQTGTGGRTRLMGISKRGDTYVRTLLTHGARSVIANASKPSPWVLQLAQRRPPSVVIVALANHMARVIWAVLAHGKPYRADPTAATTPA